MNLLKNPNLTYTVSTINDGNMSYLRGDSNEALQNRRKFLGKWGLEIQDIVTTNLVHGTTVLKVTTKDKGNAILGSKNGLEADGLITNQPGVNLFILTADCHAIALFDPKNQAIGLIHAGWRGLDKGILPKAIKKITAEFGSDPKDLLAQFSPSIGPCCYKGLTNIHQKDDPRWQPYITQAPDGTYSLDLWSFAEDQLLAAGLTKNHLDNPRLCTYHNLSSKLQGSARTKYNGSSPKSAAGPYSGTYFSHRGAIAENLDHDYRFATVLGIKQ